MIPTKFSLKRFRTVFVFGLACPVVGWFALTGRSQNTPTRAYLPEPVQTPVAPAVKKPVVETRSPQAQPISTTSFNSNVPQPASGSKGLGSGSNGSASGLNGSASGLNGSASGSNGSGSGSASGSGSKGSDSSSPSWSPAPSQIATSRTLTFHESRELARRQQPTTIAARESLALAELRLAAVSDLPPYANLFQKDLHIRREQSQLGISIAKANLAQAEVEAVYAATRNYLTLLYTREQIELAERVEKRIETDTRPAVQLAIKNEKQFYRETHLDKIDALTAILKSRKEEAKQGQVRAGAAFREAIGVPCDLPLVIVDSKLPDLPITITYSEILNLAYARRGELYQVTLAAEVIGKEVEAQKTSKSPSKETFASRSDIHSQPLPTADWDKNYRPGALGIEMPAFLTGTVQYRVEQAMILEHRAQAVIEKTRGLIALEVQDAFMKLQESVGKIKELREAQKKAQANLKKLQEIAKEGKARHTADELIDAGILETQIQVEINIARYEYNLALAALERVTAGGFNAGFDHLTSP